jgi:transcriptional regulator with XRE-family HTH domain
MTIAQRIKDLRTKYGMTQAELCHASGLFYTTVSRYENGKMQPSMENLQKLAKGFDMSVTEFIAPVDK